MMITPVVSVIIPVFNGAATLADCLRTVYASALPKFEVIVVDDGSTDGSADIASRFPCRLIQLPGNVGPSEARNTAAAQAAAPLLFFLDADILIRPDSLSLVFETFAAQPHYDALFGSYTPETVPANFVTRYKNLLHHYTHQTSNSEAVTFCGGFGAIRRDVFLRLRGFNPKIRFLEDIEFGHRLHLHGHRILLLKSLQLTHCKTYTLLSLVRSDLFGRAIPWSRLIMETKVIKSDLNLRFHNVASVPLSYLILLSPLLALPWLTVSLALFFLFLNGGFLGFVTRLNGPLFGLRSSAMLWFGYLYSGVGAALGTLQYFAARRRPARAVPSPEEL